MPATTIPRTGPLSYGYRRTATHLHRGVDIGAPEGAPVYAPYGGTVRFASAELEPGFSGYGGHVVIASALGEWLFAHLSSVRVQPGDTVQRGTLIGTVGRTCYSRHDPQALCAGPHVHVELSPASYPQAPEAPRLDPVPALEQAGGVAFLFSGDRQAPEIAPPPSLPRAVAARDRRRWALALPFVALGFAAAVWRRR